MKICLFDGHRVGVVTPRSTVVDVTSAVPGWRDDPLADFFVRLCRDFGTVRPAIEAAAAAGAGTEIDLGSVTLAAPVLNPSKVVAAAMNYAAHRTEMEIRPDRSGLAWRMEFDVFLKAPSSIVGPTGPVVLPDVGDNEVHHECELAFVVGRGGRDIPVADALDHVMGYTTLVDVTVRGPGDRSRRKSYDTFSPTGPYLVTRDEVPDPQALTVDLTVGGEARQHVHTGEMLVSVAEIIAYASSIMTLVPGDLFCTGAPPGVGPIVAGDTMRTAISGLGSMEIPVVAAGARTPEPQPERTA